MHRMKLLLGLMLVALATAGIAVATKENRTHTDTPGATFTLAQTASRSVTCTGQDGEYREYRATWSGPTASADPRLTGTLTVRGHGLTNLTTDRGTLTGHWALRSATGKRVAGGSLWSAYRIGTVTGLMLGRVHDRTGDSNEELSGSGKIIANFKATLAAGGGPLAGNLGNGGPDDRTPAVIQAGGCKGPGHANARGKDKGKGKDDDRGKHKPKRK